MWQVIGPTIKHVYIKEKSILSDIWLVWCWNLLTGFILNTFYEIYRNSRLSQGFYSDLKYLFEINGTNLIYTHVDLQSRTRNKNVRIYLFNSRKVMLNCLPSYFSQRRNIQPKAMNFIRSLLFNACYSTKRKKLTTLKNSKDALCLNWL